MGGAAARGAGGGRCARGGAPGARRARDRVGRAGVRLLARRPRHGARGQRADGVPPPDRAPDDRRQRGGRRAARGAQGARALPHPRAARARAGRAAGRPARLARGPDAAAAAADVAAAGGRAGGGDLAHGRRPRPPHRPRPRGAHLARAALAQAGALRAGQQRPRRAALAPLLPLHVADPPLSRPRLPPRAAVRGRRRRGRAGGVADGGDRRVGVQARARRDVDRALRRRRRPLLPARGRAVQARLAHRVGRAR